MPSHQAPAPSRAGGFPDQTVTDLPCGVCAGTSAVPACPAFGLRRSTPCRPSHAPPGGRSPGFPFSGAGGSTPLSGAAGTSPNYFNGPPSAFNSPAGGSMVALAALTGGHRPPGEPSPGGLGLAAALAPLAPQAAPGELDAADMWYSSGQGEQATLMPLYAAPEDDDADFFANGNEGHGQGEGGQGVGDGGLGTEMEALEGLGEGSGYEHAMVGQEEDGNG
ncbi:hypothetical protein GPECTOR_3g107 [Gonium pectorale]|uniref:Uncharacterized protein n=1 Tax=Gonium pectorale TaxID=33097 RepID=A0A150GYF5_GONPE|nr:hypothetical protein GPECTOR_3g107 [Gonium pectorale]|eukprot:KXZ54937.1 hypothetical protein GPECTOR_3g107 [Gonium pectorale]